MIKRAIPPLFGLTLAVAALAIAVASAMAQSEIEPVNDLPNPYEATDGHLRMPIGRDWGAVGAIEVDPDGKSIWVAERCGSDSLNPRYTLRSCADSDLPVVLKFNSDGIMVRSFGGGLFAMPHGIHVDREGNVWVTDAPFTLGADGPANKGHHIIKFSPQGEILLRLGVPGEPGNDARHFNMPSDVITAPNGDIFVADRSNNRIQIFDQDGNFLDEWYQFSRLSGIFIDKIDVLYGVDSESNAARGREDWRRGIRVGSARTGEVWAFIPDPTDPRYMTSSGGEGVVADADGVIYSAEVGNRSVKRYHRYIDP